MVGTPLTVAWPSVFAAGSIATETVKPVVSVACARVMIRRLSPRRPMRTSTIQSPVARI